MGGTASVAGLPRLSDGTLAELEQLPEAAQAELVRAAQSRVQDGSLVDVSTPRAVAAPAVAANEQAAEEQPQADLTRYNNIDSIEAFAAEGDVGFVNASYYLELAAQGSRFPRRQEVPPHAVVGKAALKRMADEVRAWRKLLAEHAGKGLEFAMRFPPFVVVSYAWLSKEHPDPDGRQLREVLAPAIEWYMAERARLIKGWEGYDYYESRLGPAARLDAPFTAEGVDFAIFVDYCGLWQHERTPEQDASFRRGLGSMDLLYAHQEVAVWRMTRLLDGYDVLAYDLRGWPFFETAASHYIKHPHLCLDLGSEDAVKALAGFEGRLRPPEELESQGDYKSAGAEGRLGKLMDKTRPPPLVPSEFAKRVEPLTLTNGKDKDVLIELQAKVATTVLSNVEELQYAGMKWGQVEAPMLAQAVACCERLRTLSLSGTYLGDAGMAAVVSALPRSGPLASLDLRYTRSGVLVAKALASALSEGLPALKQLNLGTNRDLDDDAKQLVRDAVSGRDGFELKLP